MVVALHLEHHREPVADVDDAGILARPLDHPGRRGRQPAQMHLRGFVGAMLIPHSRKNAELGQRRLAADQIEDALVLVGLEPVFGDEFRGDVGFVGDHATSLRSLIQTSKSASVTCIFSKANWLGILKPLGNGPCKSNASLGCVLSGGTAAVRAQIIASTSSSFSTLGTIFRVLQREVKASAPPAPLYLPARISSIRRVPAG
jgi:hypothetical protein